jgi:hypothetical protein
MKPPSPTKNCLRWSATLLGCAIAFSEAVEPLTFVLNTSRDAVAVQFDVMLNQAGITLTEPSFQGISPHKVESAVVGSGATRFVVYSTSGLPISDTGEVIVDFSASSPASGILSVSGVIASDGEGKLTEAAPNGRPVIEKPQTLHRSQLVGVPTVVSAKAYDVDGQITSLSFAANGIPFATVSPPQSLSAPWTFFAPALVNLSVTATDNQGGTEEIDLGTLRGYQASELATYADFEEIHFGPSPDSPRKGFDNTPTGSPVTNGLAWMLGINPNAPDFSRLPSGTVETDGPDKDFVFRFNRLASHPGADWNVLESPDLGISPWSAVPGIWITQTPVGDGTVDVEVRKPIDPLTEPKAFLTLEATQQP